MTVGTDTLVDSSSRTARPMCRRRIRRSAAVCRASGAGRAPCDFIRCTHIQPLNSRSVNSATPASQTDTNNGSHSSTDQATEAASAGMASAGESTAGATGAGTSAALVVATFRDPAVSSQTGLVAASVCTTVTTGIVSINASAIVETTYRTSGPLRRRAASRAAVSNAMSVPCQTNCSRAHPIA